MKQLCFLLVSLLFSASVFAERVSMAEALKTARAFMPGEKFEILKYSSSSTDSKAGEEPFYIFNKVDGNGFVLVSADDRTTDILGYSDNSSIDMTDLPDNVRYWFESYAQQIKALDEGVPAVKRTKTRATLEEIEPLIKTQWNQGSPYNLRCPDGDGIDYGQEGYNKKNRSLAGCVATAVAEIMYYYKQPTGTTTAIPSYSFKKYKTGKIVTLEELEPTTFKWDLMRATAKEYKTSEEAYAVAELMRYVGQANRMNYNTSSDGGSGTLIRNNMMQQCFGYSKYMRSQERDYYSTSQWEAMVYDELANGRPLPYGGYSDDGGHQFVCDGYRDGLFHFNWGWGGLCDGYFVLSIADSDATDGIGGYGEYCFKYEQDAVFCFMPAGDDERDIPQLWSIVDANYQAQTYTRDNATDPFTGITLSSTYAVSYDYEATESYDAEVGWALYQGDQFVESLGSTTLTISYEEHNSEKLTNELTDVTLGSALPDGKYQLRQVFRQANTEENWTLMDNYGTQHLVAEISDNTLTVRGTNKNSVWHVNSIGISDHPVTGRMAAVTVNITNDGEIHDQSVSLWIEKEGAWTKVAKMVGFVDAGETGDVVLYFAPTEAGTFDLKVTSGKSETAMGTASITVFQAGDANGDNEVTTSDAVDALGYILGESPDGFDAKAADMNGDGEVTVTDVLMMIDQTTSK